MVVDDEGAARDLLPQVLSRMGSSVPLQRGGQNALDHAGEALFKRKVIALIEAARDRTRQEAAASRGVALLESPFPLYEFL